MKNLKRFLIVGLFSFIFFICNVHATTSNYSMTLKYSDTFYEQVINASDRINNLHTYLENRNNGNICFDSVCNNIHSGNVALIYRYIDTDNWLVSLVNNNNMKTFYSSSNVNNSYMQIYFSHMTQFNVSFNSSNNITSFSGYMTGTDNLWFSLSGIDINNSDYTAYQSYKYVDTYYLNDSQVIQYNSGSGGLDIKLNVNDNIYTPVVNINAKDLLDSMVPFVPTPITCNHNQVLGAVSNANDLVFKIKGVSNALSKPIWGRIMLEFSDNSFHTSDEFNVEFINFLSGQDADVEGSYSFTCNDSGSACFLEYSYNYIDDIDTNVEFGFKIRSSSGNTMPSFIKLFNCFDNDDYYNITYTYTNSSGGTISNDNVLNNFLQDGSVPDVSGLSDTNIIPTGPVDSILTLPLNIMRSLLNTLNSSTCSPLVLPIPFSGGNLTLPCISTLYAKINGLNVFLTWFSSIFSAFLLYQYFIYLYKWVDDTLTFRENNHFGGY